MATEEPRSATEALFKPVIESTNKFMKATGIRDDRGTILEAIYRLKVTQVDGMPADIVDAPLLVNAMNVIEAKGLTGTEAALEFDKAATLIFKATELAWAGEDVDEDVDEVVTSVAEVTGMTMSEVLSILTLPLVPDPSQYSHMEDSNSLVRAQAKDATSDTEVERPDDMAWFTKAAASVAETTGMVARWR